MGKIEFTIHKKLAKLYFSLMKNGQNNIFHPLKIGKIVFFIYEKWAK